MFSKTERINQLMKQILARLSTVTVMVLMLTLVLGVSSASAARDRTPPTTPSNLRVTGMTAYSVSLAWDPSTDKSGERHIHDLLCPCEQ